MSVFYLDTSAIVKRYFPETGTGWIQKLADPGSGNTLLPGELTLAETAAVIAAKQRSSGGITLVERDAILQRFLQHCNDEYVLVPIERKIVDRAVLLAQQHRLRGYDAVRLAVALLANKYYHSARMPGLTFVAADDDLVAAARAEGLAAENPNNYP
ncbi:type II toxin-antitoxin system VapC family toxin [Roseiflexus sp.]